MRIHGVSTGFIREMAEVGYEEIPTETLTRMRIHGVDADFVSELAEHNFTGLSANDLIEAKIHSGWWRRRDGR
jgi:hypothetical protein